MNILKNIVKRETVDTRQFSYSKNKVNLGFTLRIDTKTELKDFKDLLLKAIEDIEIELKK